MRNFFLFIWNNQFTFLFFVLEFIGFALLTTNNGFHQSKLHSASASLSGNLAETRDSYTQYIGLKEENDNLQEENRRLRSLLTRPRRETDINLGSFRCASAHAINSTYSLGNNFIILDKGSEEGMELQQGVIGPEGVIGVISKVSAHYSTVLPLIHSQSMLSCKLAKNHYFGILHWDGRDDRFALLEDIPNHIDVLPGDSIVTRGASGVFPANLFVGTAVESEKDESSGFQTIQVRLATDFRKVYSVYVVQNESREEVRTQIEEAQGDEP
jgi:rod shape-determining protein MreC